MPMKRTLSAGGADASPLEELLDDEDEPPPVPPVGDEPPSQAEADKRRSERAKAKRVVTLGG